MPQSSQQRDHLVGATAPPCGDGQDEDDDGRLCWPQREGRGFLAEGTRWARGKAQPTPPSSRVGLRQGSGLGPYGSQRMQALETRWVWLWTSVFPVILSACHWICSFQGNRPRDPEPQPKPLGLWEHLGSIYLFICSFVPNPC